MSKVNAFDVFSRMVEQNDKAIQLAPLGNLIGARKDKQGSKVTIGIAEDVVPGIAVGKYVGGLILCDKERYAKVKAQMERESPPEAPKQ
jgi:hypothetical protein